MPAGIVVPAAIRLEEPGAMPPAANSTPQTASTTPGTASSTAAVGLSRGRLRTGPIVGGFSAAVAGLVVQRVGDDQEQSGASELIFAYAFHWRRDGALQVKALDHGGGGGFSGRITNLVHDVRLHVTVVGRVTDSGNRILVEHQLAGGLSSHAVGAEPIPDGNWRLRGGWCGNDHYGRGLGSGGGARLPKCGVQRGPAPNEANRKDCATGEDA